MQAVTKQEWRYPCPKCKARVGETCTYLTDAQRWTAGGTQQVVLHHAGDPTVRSHNERLTYQERKRRKLPPVQGPSPAVKALWEYDRHEYRTMQAWLRANHGIFQ